MSTLTTGYNALLALPTVELVPLIAIPAYFLVCLPIFAIRCLIWGVPRSKRLDGGSRVMPRFLLEYGYWMLHQQVRLILALGLSANGVTVLSLLFAVTGAAYIGAGRFSIGGWLMFFSFFCDALDGMVARMRGTASDRGEFFDAFVDRYADLVTGFGFLYYYRYDPLPAALVALMMIGMSVMGYARAKGEAVGIDPNVGWMQRHERGVYIGVGTVLSPIVAAFVEPGAEHPRFHLAVVAIALVALFTNITAVWRAVYVLQRMPQPDRRSPPAEEPATMSDEEPGMPELAAGEPPSRPSGGESMSVSPPGTSQKKTRFADIRTPLPGPRSQALTAAEREYLAPGTQAISQMAGIAVDHGEGALLCDVDGNTFVDFVAGICVASLGHGHPALAEALGDQARKIAAGSFASEPRRQLLERIASITPFPSLKRTQLYSGGAEAVESALRLARAYTKKYEVVAFWGGFHGKTGGVLGLLGSEFKHHLGPLQPGTYLSPYADCYRCPLGTSYPGCGLACVDFLRQLIKLNTTGSLAAIIVEPIQGTAGNVIPPDDWLPAVKSVAREFGALLVLDEMITGFGRTGRMFGAEHFGVEADIMTFGKGVASGFPLTGLITTDEIVRPDKADPWSRPSFSSSSYGGAPLGAAAGNAVTRVLVEQKIPEQVAAVGDALLEALRPLQERYPFVGEVRGKGLMIAIELVKDKRSREPLDKATCDWIFQQCLRRGLLTMAYAPRVRINPPLVISRDQALEGAAILDEVFQELSVRSSAQRTG